MNKTETELKNNSTKRIIVIGASSGGLEALRKIIQGLPPDFDSPIFIVWHMSPDIRGVLPQVFNKINTIEAAHAYNKEEIKSRRIYIAPPDHHMLLEQDRILLTRGPKENRFRPAIDPLFRSAAYVHGSRVIGIILSGALDDGTAGLWTVKHFGGIAIVQDPLEAEVSSMPENAMREVNVDYCVGVAEMPSLLVRLCNEPVPEKAFIMRDDQTKKEIEIAAEKTAMENGVLRFKDLSPYTCPECHGVLSRLQNDKIIRYRCHTGHAYSADTLMAAITEKIEDGLYSAIRAMDESIMLLNHVGDHYAEVNQPALAAVYFKKAEEANDRSMLVRKAVVMNEQYDKEVMEQESLPVNGQ